MVYLLYGIKDYAINDEIRKISKDILEMNVSKYDLNNDLIDDVINDCETFSMFQDSKIVIADNANMFTGGSSKDVDKLEKYISNINPSTILILVVHNNKIDGRKKITTLVKSKGKVIEFNDDINVESYVKKSFGDYNIDYNSIRLFVDRVGNNIDILKNEIEKVKLYKGEDLNITSDDIINVTVNTIDTDIFTLIDNIVTGKKENAIEAYHNMLIVNQDPFQLLGLLADQFRIMFQSKELFMKGYNEKNIADTIKIHPYRVKLALNNGRKYSSDILLSFLGKLADLDIGIKTGNMNKCLAFELFLLKI